MQRENNNWMFAFDLKNVAAFLVFDLCVHLYAVREFDTRSSTVEVRREPIAVKEVFEANVGSNSDRLVREWKKCVRVKRSGVARSCLVRSCPKPLVLPYCSAQETQRKTLQN